MNPPNRKDLLSLLIAAATTAVLLNADAKPVQAYDYMYPNLAYSLLWPLTSTFGYGITNPYYVMNRLMLQNAYSPYGYLPYGNTYNSYGSLRNLSGLQNFSNYQPNGLQGNFTTQGNFNQPGNLYQPVVFNPQRNSNQQGNYIPPTNSNNSLANQQGQVNSNQGQSYNWQNQPNAQSADPFSTQNPGYLASNPGQAAQIGTPPVPALAPSRFVGKEAQSPQSSFVAGFFDLLANKYRGDVTRAFKDGDMQAWAAALGIPVPDASSLAKLGHVRKQAIASLLKDNSLDANGKVEALRILLR